MLQNVKHCINKAFSYHLIHNVNEIELLCPVLTLFSEASGSLSIIKKGRDFPGGTVVKNPPANAGDTGLIPGPGRSHMLRSN